MFSKQAQIAFLESLYAVYFNSAGEFESKKADIQSAVTNAESLQIWRSFDSGENVKDLLAGVRKGQNIEMKPLGVHLKKMVTEDPSVFGQSALGAVLKFALYFRTGSEGAANSIRKLSGSTVFSSWVRGGFAEKSIDQSAVSSQIKSFVKSVTGKPALGLTKEQAEELRAEDRPKYREYLVLRKAFADSWKNEAANFIRGSGKTQVPMKDLLSHLDKQKLDYSIVPGFTGSVGIGPGGELEWFSREGKRIVGVPSPTFFSKVEMNESREPGEYVFTATPAAGGAKAKYFYLAEDLRTRKDEKFQMIRDVAPLIKHVRTVWLEGIRHFDLDDDKTVAALLLELSYEFASRIGTEGNSTKGQSTYGLSTSLVRHLKMLPNGFTLTYQGKDNVKTSHKYTVRDATSKMVFEAMKDLVEGKAPTDPIFTVGSEKPKPIRPALVTSVFRRLVGHNKISVHKMRTLRGTVLFSELAEAYLSKNAGKTLSPSRVESDLKDMAAKVGLILNHVRTSADGEPKVTGETALNAYIDPGVQARIFEGLGLQLPKSLLKRMGKHRLDSSTLFVIAADEEVTDEELDQMEEDLGDSDPSGEDEVLPADDEEVEPSEEVEPEESDQEKEVLPADEPSGEDSPKEKKEEPKEEEEEEKKEKEPSQDEGKETMDESRLAAQDSAEDDSALLSRILQDPGVGENT